MKPPGCYEKNEAELRQELAELAEKFTDQSITPSEARRFRDIKAELREIENARHGIQRW